MSDYNETGGVAETGETDQVERLGRDASKAIKDQAAGLGESISAAASTATDKAKDVYSRATEQYEAAADRIDPFVRERPYAAIGIAAGVALLAGLLWAGRGSKVVYLKPAPRG